MRDSYQIEQRRYGFGFSTRLTRVVKVLIIVNVAAFAVRALAKLYFDIDPIVGLVPLSVVKNLAIWQPFTYFLFHSSVWHLLINILILWMFGSDVEAETGPRLFALYYISLSVISGAVSVILAPFSTGTIFGPAASIFGILMAFGILFPERVVTLLLLLVIPVNIKAKYLAFGFVVIELLTLIDSPALSPSNFAPLTAIPLSFFFVRYLSVLDSFFDKLILRRELKRFRVEDESRDVFIESKIDPILDKISKEGIHSLTRKERKILKEAKSKLTKR